MSRTPPFHIRPAEDQDLDQLIHVLRSALGEKLLPKSTEFWKWKHEQNPFGKSPVLVAETNGELVGVRTFLRWKYDNTSQSIHALRAVDTAILPAFQGKGLFTQLTLALLELEKDNQLVFNTPNKSSLPGYLKMGWVKWGKLPIKIKPIPFPGTPKKLPEKNWNSILPLIPKLQKSSGTSHAFSTQSVPGYFSWRYQTNPLVKYSFLSDESSFILFFRIKQGKLGLELRITDFFTSDSFDLISKKNLNRELNSLIQQSGARWVTCSGLTKNLDQLDLGFIPALQLGPLVTLRNLDTDFDGPNQLWNWSLGDLELF
ncbi:GNAT family N-acetyltransferase [Algoriphagus sp.]|uniref:GNAT family N-acetyltransferase n=1 Tax=Algoriphagus sp. TaxID=1872435 RepID=UPI00262DA773|nr:GNAT family N-acetyltransferase [Algoriphagus sp.]